MAEQRWVTINGHHVLINADEFSDTGKSDAKKGKVVPGKGAVKDVKGKQVQEKAWKDMTHLERIAEMQKDAERYAEDPTIADKEKWSHDYRSEVIDYARPIMAEKRRSATIKNPGSQTKKQRLEAARQEVENAKNIEDVSASQLAKKYNLSSEEAGQLVWNRANNKSNKQEPLGNKGTSVGAGEMYDRLHPSKSATIKNPGGKKQTTQDKVDKLLSGRSASASNNMVKEINYQSKRVYGKVWDSLREDEKADVYEVLKRHHPEWF